MHGPSSSRDGLVISPVLAGVAAVDGYHNLAIVADRRQRVLAAFVPVLP